ncbi:anthrone oxygenase family protein [Jatrophihabitans fulvus]
MPNLTQTLGTTAALGAGLVGGVFFAFSGFVMPALRRLPSADGVRAMQSINRTAVQPPLMIALFGTAAVSVAAGVRAARHLDESWARWTLAAAIAYVAAGVVVTIGANVPLNDGLAALDPAAAGSQWETFLSRWTAWNHVRTVGCAAACALFVTGALGSSDA